MLKWLQGKKTYIVIVVGIIYNGCVAMGYLDASSLTVVNSILAALGLGALRAGVSGK